MDNLRPYEEEAYFRSQGLKKTIVGACMQLHFQKWLKEEGGVDKLDAWFQEYPQHYDLHTLNLPKRRTPHEQRTKRSNA